MGRGKSLAQGSLRSAGLELGLFYLYSRQPLSQSHRVRAITSTWCSLLSHSWWGPLMNVRGGSTILRALGVSKNYSIFIWYKSTFFTLFFSLLSLGNTNASTCLSLFHSWALPLIFSLCLLLISSYLLSSPQEIMWLVWGFCSPVRRVDQLGGIFIRLWGNFL